MDIILNVTASLIFIADSQPTLCIRLFVRSSFKFSLVVCFQLEVDAYRWTLPTGQSVYSFCHEFLIHM